MRKNCFHYYFLKSRWITMIKIFVILDQFRCIWSFSWLLFSRMKNLRFYFCYNRIQTAFKMRLFLLKTLSVQMVSKAVYRQSNRFLFSNLNQVVQLYFSAHHFHLGLEILSILFVSFFQLHHHILLNYKYSWFIAFVQWTYRRS